MSGWGSLRAITEEAKQIAKENREREEIDCPICGTVLEENSAGAVNCPMGHYRNEVRGPRERK